MKAYVSFLFTSFFAFSLGISVAMADADLGIAGSVQCDAAAFYDALGQSESGGCGGGNQYNCVGPVIKSGMHKGHTPLGKYQFMPKTLANMGISQASFLGNAAVQDAAIKQFTSANDACLERNGAYDQIGQVRNGVTITRSGLLGAAHLGGCGGASKWAKGGSGPSDQLGTSLADYHAKFSGYGMFGDVPGVTCGGGVAGAADIFAQAQADGKHPLIGCDTEVLNSAKDIVDALNEAQVEAAKSIISQPNSIEMMACGDQHNNIIDSILGLFSNKGQTSGNASVVKHVKAPYAQNISQYMSGNIAGSITSMFNQSFASTIGTALNQLTGGLTGALGGIGGASGGGSTNKDCGLQDEAWLLAQCIEMPQIPSLPNILGGKIAEIQGAVSDLTNPERLLQKVCSGANSAIQDKLGGLFNKAESTFEKAADSITTPITDAASNLAN